MASNNSSNFWPQWSENKLFALLLAVLLVYSIVFVGAAARKLLIESRHIGVNNRDIPMISITATGKAKTANDVATVTLGVTTNGDVAKDVADKNTTTANAVIAGVKALGIDEKDIQTSSYTVNPTYSYKDGTQTTTGFEASQMITVKIRSKDVQSKVLQAAQDLGANQIGNLQFSTEDDTAALSAARTDAIKKAYDQAETVAKAMGAHLVRVVRYSENQDQGGPIVYPMAMDKSMSSGSSVAPSIEPGQNDVSLTVYVDFSIE